MRKASNKQSFLRLQNTTLCIQAMLFFSLSAYSQTNIIPKDTNTVKLNPIFLAALKKTPKPNPLLQEHIKPSKHELMYWPNYPLTQAQIDARNREYKKSVAGYIARDIIKSYVNTLIYGPKMPPAVLPKF